MCYFLREIGQCFNQLGEDANCRSIVLSGAGKLFSAGKPKKPPVFTIIHIKSFPYGHCGP